MGYPLLPLRSQQQQVMNRRHAALDVVLVGSRVARRIVGLLRVASGALLQVQGLGDWANEGNGPGRLFLMGSMRRRRRGT